MQLHLIDLFIFTIYMLIMLGIGYRFHKKNSSHEDYYVGGRNINATHIGLSVVATDVGGGFSIGLGGLGFLIGLSGSWLLFTGLIGAWLSMVILIPKMYKLAHEKKFLSFPQILGHFYNEKVAFLAGIISLIGYIGFTSSQILAGAKLASASFPQISILQAVLIMGAVVIAYTVMGGIKAVIYTDTVQWIILMFGLIFIGIPIGYNKVGGWEAIQKYLDPDLLSLTNISFVQFINWLITIVPIWFVGMTLYQRIFAAKDVKSAKKAWFIAGLFEWPVMAFMGVTLGLLGRVAFEQNMLAPYGYAAGSMIDEEIALPIFLAHIFPVGLMGLLMSAYFSAIMSTADSCLMAASGNLMTDIFKSTHNKRGVTLSQISTLIIGCLAILLSLTMQNVLSLMLYSYSFMVSGLFVPVLGVLFLKNPSSQSAFYAMLSGGGTTLILIISKIDLPFGLDPNFFGIGISAFTFLILNYSNRNKNPKHK